MKKISFFMVILMAGFIFCSCSKVSVLELSKEKTSEVRENFYYQEKDDYVLTFSSGMREKDYNLDGVNSGEVVEFGLITLYSKSHALLNDYNSTYSLAYNDEDILGNLERNPYDGSLVADIGTKINQDTINIKLYFNNQEIDFELVNVSKDWAVKSGDALEIACVHLANELEKYVSKGRFYGEVYIKIAYNFSLNNDCMWYVKFLAPDFSYVSVVIDVATGNVISSSTDSMWDYKIKSD